MSIETDHPENHWREFIPPVDTPRSQELACSNTYQWAEARCREPFVAEWKKIWETLHREPYRGITTDGQVIPNLYHLSDGAGEGHDQDQGAPVRDMVEAAEALLKKLNPVQRQAIVKSIDAPEWRQWMNPEIYMYRHGLRLEEVDDTIVAAIHDLVRASLSPAGFAKAQGCMKVNGFLGQVVNGRHVLNERSYNMTLFGEPSHTDPWGWQLHGHHMDINCLVVGTQMVISPVFMGAEPNIIDDGPDRGTELFTDQEQTALKLISTMDTETRDRVRVYQSLNGEGYPEGRYHRADQRHLGGAFQDNRVIPYEGACVTSLTTTQQDLIRSLTVQSLSYLPGGALVAKMAEIDRHWDQTYFCWIGEFQRASGFYYKVHSPVVMVEFDHHSGVFLNNRVPLPFHIHTLVRTPNGNDYGKALVEEYRKRQSQKGGEDIR